jgi:hypothetical protein
MWTLVHPDRPVTLLAFRSELAAELYRQEWMLEEFVVRPYAKTQEGE